MKTYDKENVICNVKLKDKARQQNVKQKKAYVSI